MTAETTRPPRPGSRNKRARNRNVANREAFMRCTSVPTGKQQSSDCATLHYPLFVLVRLTNPAGFKAHNLPLSRWIAHIHSRIAIAAGDIAFRRDAVDLCYGSDHCGGAVETHFTVEEPE